MIGESSERENAFYSILCASEIAGSASEYAIGVCSEGHGTAPQLLLSPEQETLTVGVDSAVIGVRIRTQPEEVFRISLDSLFRSFLRFEPSRLLLAFHEIGVVAIDDSGQQVWKFSLDVLESASLHGNALTMEFMDSDPVR